MHLGQIFRVHNEVMEDCLKNLKLKIKASPVNAGLYKAFKNHFSFETVLAANFGCYPGYSFKILIMAEIVSRFL